MNGKTINYLELSFHKSSYLSPLKCEKD